MAGKRRFRVYFEQINATFVEVEVPAGGDKHDAIEKAGRKWRKEYAWPSISGETESSVVDITEEK